MTDEDTTPKTTTKRAPKAAEVAPENIVQAVAAIRKEAGALAPAQKNGIPFAFRGIDGTVAHLVPALDRHGVITVPNVVYCNISEREDKSGRVVKTTDVLVSYDFIAPDGSKLTATVPGLADDYSDRSTAQAMSVAFRIALLQTFTLPTHSPEPEETGQAVLNGAGAAPAAAPRAANAVERAKASATAKSAGTDAKLKGYQMEAKVLGGKLSKSSSDLNSAGTRIAEAEGVTDWFNNETVMGKLVAELKAEAGE